MKDLYSAIRGLIFPPSQSHTRPNGVAFLTGARMGSQRFSPKLRQLLVQFERQNRGHRDLLGLPALNVHAGQKCLDSSARRVDKIRAKLSFSLSDLFQYLMVDRSLSLTPGLDDSFDAVLDARDELGYIEALVKFALRSDCETEAFTSKTAFNVVSVRLELDVQPVLLHVRIAVGEKKATRSIPLVSADVTTLRGARLLLDDAAEKLGGWFRDVSLWPEFRPEGAKPLIEVQGPGMSAPMYLSPDQASQLELPQVDPAPVTAPAAETADALTDADAALLGRLQHDMRGFLAAYSPRTRAFMERHWDAFRDVVNEPGEPGSN